MNGFVGEWKSPDLPGTGDAAAAWVADTLCAAGIRADALYVVTPDGGVREALSFWAAAQQTGPAFANPGAFPWTLANSTAGRVAQELEIHGPCTTFVAGDEAVEDVRSVARDDIADGHARHALVLLVRSDGAPEPVGGAARWQLTAWLEE